MAEEVTDHALIRFIERVKGVSLDDYRRELDDILDATTKWSRSPSPESENTCLMVVERGTLITILPPGKRGKAKDKHGYTRFAEIAPTPPHGSAER